MRSRLYRRLLDLGPGYLSSARTGAVKTTLVDAVEFLDKYVGLFLPQLVVSLAGAAALAVYLSTIDPVVGAVVLVCALRLAQGQLTVTELLIVLLLSRECFRPLG